jgi:hypothetical protein
MKDEMGIYFEYAYIRDLWNSIRMENRDSENNLKKRIILDLLKPINRNELEEKNAYDFNKHFGAVRTLSSDYIASPGNWSIKYFNGNISDNEEFLNVCKFKWCFNAKPDIVIHTSKDTAICIEAKYESGEGQYPSSNEEKQIFKERFGKNLTAESYLVGQLQIQKKIMEEILGIKTKFIYLVQKGSTSSKDDVLTVTWADTFRNLSTDGCPHFIQEWIQRLQS